MSAQLAQINIARARGAMDTPVMAEFVNALDEINALAESSPGFVWRFKTDEGHAIGVQSYPDPLIFINLSVWTAPEALKAYVYGTTHAKYFSRRAAWFEKLAGMSFALWWIPAEVRPTVAEAQARLHHRDRHGDTPYAFSFKQTFSAAAGLGALPRAMTGADPSHVSR
jgi:Domain of unknown function (DUF3291)